MTTHARRGIDLDHEDEAPPGRLAVADSGARVGEAGELVGPDAMGLTRGDEPRTASGR